MLRHEFHVIGGLAEMVHFDKFSMSFSLSNLPTIQRHGFVTSVRYVFSQSMDLLKTMDAKR